MVVAPGLGPGHGDPRIREFRDAADPERVYWIEREGAAGTNTALLGAPVFIAMGGIALVLFFSEGTPVGAVSAEVYRLIASPTLPAIPLLTAAGYVLAESGAASRLVRFFRAVFGWMPGGIAVMVAAVMAALLL